MSTNNEFEKVNIWPKDEAYRRLLEAILIFKDLHGSYDTTKFLQQEITRETVVREYHASNNRVIAAEAALAQANQLFIIASDALSFYEDKSNYKCINGQPSAVAKDKGRTAAQALEAINSEGPPQFGEQVADNGEDE